MYRHNLLFQRGYFSNDRIQGMPAKVRSSLAYNEIKTFDITGGGAVDYLCEIGLGIMSGSYETTKLSKIKVQRVLPETTGENIKINLKIDKRLLSKNIGKLAVNWLFSCRDTSLKKVDVTPTYEFNGIPLKN